MALIDPDRVVTPLRAVALASARRSRLPAWCDALVEEQDRWLVLGQGPERADRDPEGYSHELALTSVDELLDAANRSEPAPPGAVLLRRTRPTRLLAVVHDLERHPTVEPEWVGQALETIMRLATRAGMRGIALPVLGSRSRARDVETFAELLAEALWNEGPARLRIALLAEPRLTGRIAATVRETVPELHVETL